MVIKRAFRVGVPAVAALLGCGSLASGSFLIGDGSASTEQTGAAFTAEASYAFQGGNLGLITILLTNDTAPEIGGFITGFVFNVSSGDPAASLSLVSAPGAAWLDIAGSSAMPFGSPFMGGAAIGGNWEGGGGPEPGLGVGITGMFTFRLEASDADAFSELSIGVGPLDHDFVVRFRGLLDGGSDKVPAGPPSRDLPSPGAAALAGLAAAMLLRRRR